MLADSKLPIIFWAEAVSTACYVQNRVLIVKPHNKTPYELFRGLKPDLSFMKPFGCHVTILNTLDSLGKFDRKSDEGTISNESAGIQGDLNTGTSTQKEQVSQECIVMPIWKDASYFDSSSKDVGNDEPKSASDDPKHVKEGPCNESDDKENDSSLKEDNTVEPQVNTASPGVNNASPKVMMGAVPFTKSTLIIAFCRDEDEQGLIRNILNSYAVPTTPTTRIQKDHPLENMIGDVYSSVQTRGMRRSTFEQGFLSAAYEEKTHEDLYTCLFACFLSQEEPKRVAKALSDPSWVEVMQEELL
ncbi:putative ribonuclease H-like domain-containing protein [Tanacetum coccineum]